MPDAGAWAVRLGLATLCCSLLACGPRPTGEAQRGRMSSDAMMRVAVAAEASGDMNLALSMASAAAEDAPASAPAQLLLADALIRAGKIGAARELLQHRQAGVTDQVELRQGLGQVYLLSGQPDEALGELDKVLAARPRDVRALVNRGIALDLQKRHPEAQAMYGQARAIAPDDPVIANDLALSMALQGRTTEARAMLSPWKNAGDAPPRLKTNLGVLLLASGDVGQARGLLGDRASDQDVFSLAQALPMNTAGGGTPGASP